MLRRFRLEEPESVKEVSELLARFGESAKVYAGGTELLLAMKEGLVHYERLVNIKRLSGLNEVKLDNNTVKVGALCTHHQLETSPVLQQKLPALVKLEQNVANVRVLRDFQESPLERHAREQPHLLVLPTCDFDTALVVYRHVNVEGYLTHRLNFYSAR